MADGDRDLSGTGRVKASIDTSVAQIARVYDYLLAGKDNFAADRHLGDLMRESYPDAGHSVRANRAFLARAVRFLAGEAGVRQFLDIGAGMPAADNTHEVAQRVAPESRIVYVDNDAMVIAHARALLTSEPPGATGYVEADLRDVPEILDGASGLLDFGQPVAVMLLAVLFTVPDEDDPYGIVARLMAAVPAGSYLVVSYPSFDVPAGVGELALRMNKLMAQPVAVRGQAEVERFFEGLALLEPGVVPVSKWRPASEAEAVTPTLAWGAVGRKP